MKRPLVIAILAHRAWVRVCRRGLVGLNLGSYTFSLTVLVLLSIWFYHTLHFLTLFNTLKVAYVSREVHFLLLSSIHRSLVCSCFLDLWRWPAAACSFTGIPNYFVWEESLAFCGCIPTPPLPSLPNGEERCPAPTTGKGGPEWTCLPIPVLSFMFLKEEQSPHQGHLQMQTHTLKMNYFQ